MKALYAALIALPLLRAEAQTPQIPLHLQYEGTVKTVESSPYWSYSPGDRVKGVVTIYPSLAPPDLRPTDSFADYSSGGPSDFIVSEFVMGNRGSDYLDIDVGSFGRPDRYRAADRAETVGAPPGENWRDFTIEVTGMDLVKDDGIGQSFDARPKKDGSSIISALIQGLGEFRRTVTFELSHVSLGPRVCRP